MAANNFQKDMIIVEDFLLKHMLTYEGANIKLDITVPGL